MADTPTFGGYLALPSGSGDAALIAYWSDGRAARLIDRMDEAEWFPLPTPDYRALWPTPEAPVVADAPARRYGVAMPHSNEWACSCGRIHPNAHFGCGQCFDQNPHNCPTPAQRTGTPPTERAMSLYNALFGQNADAARLVSILNHISPLDPPRFRDCYFNALFPAPGRGRADDTNHR